MKKLIVLLAFVLVFVGCTEVDNTVSDTSSVQESKSFTVEATAFDAIDSIYKDGKLDYDRAKDFVLNNPDYVFDPNSYINNGVDKEIYGVAYPYGKEIVNAERYDSFIENISNKKSDSIAVVYFGYFPYVDVVEYSAENERYFLTRYNKVDGAYSRNFFSEAEVEIYESSVYIKGEHFSVRMPRNEKMTPLSIDEAETLSATHISTKVQDYLGDSYKVEYVGTVEGDGYFGETCEYFYIHTKNPETDEWIMDNTLGVSLDYKKIYGGNALGSKWLYVR